MLTVVYAHLKATPPSLNPHHSGTSCVSHSKEVQKWHTYRVVMSQRSIIGLLLLVAGQASSWDPTEQALAAGLTAEDMPRIRKAAYDIRCTVCAEIAKDCFQKVNFKVGDLCLCCLVLI